MQQKIYLDVLLAVNLFVNYFLLLTVKRILHIPVKRGRLLLGAAVGSACSLSILMPALPVAVSLLIKLTISAAVVLAAFAPMRALQLVKTTVCFYLASFAYAGFMMALWYFISSEHIMIRNSVVYFNISPLLLAIFTILSYLLLTFLNKLVGSQEPEQTYCQVCIRLNGKEVKCVGKVDTGHSLQEPFSQDPVVVVKTTTLKEILPKEMQSLINTANNAVACAGSTLPQPPKKQPYALRYVPFSTVSGQGLLAAIRADLIRVRTKKKEAAFDHCFIAFYNGDFLDGKFDALLPAMLLSGGRQADLKGEKT